ncbi:MAG: phospholipase A [Gammaproteobacteria bacterium]|nr:phospholipase A [Gammaproteobacteria bacterium]
MSRSHVALLLAGWLGSAAAAQPAVSASQAAPPPPVQPLDQPLSAPAPTPAANPSPKLVAGAHWHLAADPDAYSIVSAGSGVSLHKPMYFEPATYSPQYNGKRTEVVFQLSLKLKLFTFPSPGALYLGYTQKSFWDAYDGADSRPFRETNYNPELFYRYIPSDVAKWHHLGIDIGAEHQSNGKGLVDSRSWNRIYLAPFQAEGNHLIYWKWWYRIPERAKTGPQDSGGDDNPDIQDYYGYSELHYEQQLFSEHLLHVMLRFNPATSRGAVELQYSIPGPGDRFFWGLIVFSGYGDSLIDYNRSVTRIGLALMLTR